MASVSWPPSSKPTYPGGAPIKRLTVCFSMYSLMSILTMASSLLKRKLASVLASSVLPTPVGPKNMKEAVGRLGSARPALLRMMASATAVTASSCPTTRKCSSSGKWRSFSFSDWTSFLTGMPVHLEMTSLMSASVTSSRSSGFAPPKAPLASSRNLSARAFSASSSCFCKLWSVPYLSSAALLRSYSLSAWLASRFTRSMSSFSLCTVSISDFSDSHWAFSAACFSPRWPSSCSRLSTRA
mmetsp:Transcript_6428/g.16336  ORF Transcript_6428/g.16336 Transcript_6428/m.16336 type:complete len:241 (-) Transcript_6428:1443-2165(-)